MAAPAPTFVRRDGEILAFYEGQLIARDPNYAKCEETAVDYLDKLTSGGKMDKETSVRQAATHVEGPNGLTGEILGNVSGQWGRELTVRWSNGRITRHASHGSDGLTYKTAEASQPDSALEYLQSTLNEVPEGTKSSLNDRISVLDGLVLKANAAQHTASYEDSKALDLIALQATHEKHEVQEALAHLEASDAEAFGPPAPFHSSAVDQAALGHADGSWLDDVSASMAHEAAEQDYDKLLLEGPVEFVAELPTAVLAEAGTTANLAQEFISSKTAGVEHLALNPMEMGMQPGQMTGPQGQQSPTAQPPVAPPNLPVQQAPGAPHPGAAPSGVQAQPAPGAPPNPQLQGQQPGQAPPAAPNQFLRGMQGFSSVSDFHDAFLAKVEQARREELKDRQKAAKKQAKKAKKEASKEQEAIDVDTGDEGLFL